jgi:glycosyltransferase involved in cell wall biosynthesis
MEKISAYIIAFNEEKKIAAAIASVAWADEIVVIDSHSQDATARIAQNLGARVVQIEFAGFGALRNSAIAACTHAWIFSLDADERCTPEAAAEVRQAVEANAHDLFLVPRRNFFFGREIRHSGWYPNYRQPQLFRKGLMTYEASQVHEGYVSTSPRPIGHLQQPIWQLPYKNLEEAVAKVNRYSTLGANKPRQAGSTMGKALVHALWAFIKHYVFKAGWLDGWAGFLIAVAYFEVTFYRYAKAYELTHSPQWERQWQDITVQRGVLKHE